MLNGSNFGNVPRSFVYRLSPFGHTPGIFGQMENTHVHKLISVQCTIECFRLIIHKGTLI